MAEKPKEKPKAKSKPSKSKSTAGKGDNPRNCFSDDYRDNYIKNYSCFDCCIYRNLFSKKS